MVNKTMSNLQKVTRVSNLKEATTISNGDVLLVETATETLKVTKENLLKEISQQLNTKSDLSHTHSEYMTESSLNNKGLATETFVTNKITQEIEKTNAQLSDFVNERRNKYYVGKNHPYKTINEAFDEWKSAGYPESVIYIMNGEYLESISIPQGLTISFIGETKDGVIWRTTSGLYEDAPLWARGGKILAENITFVADHTSNPNFNYDGHSANQNAYAVHFDGGVGGKYVLRNCDLISYQDAALGCGTVDNTTIRLENCNLYSYTDTVEDYPNAELSLGHGGLLYHTYKGDGTNTIENLELINVNIFSKNSANPFKYLNYSTTVSRKNLLAINVNISGNKVSGREDLIYQNVSCVGYGNKPFFDLNPQSNGNNIDMLNYKFENDAVEFTSDSIALNPENGRSVEITSINDVTKCGYYHCRYDMPTTEYYFINAIVFGNYKWLDAVSFNGNYHYVKLCNNGVWGEWLKISDSEEKIIKLIQSMVSVSTNGRGVAADNIDDISISGYYLSTNTASNTPQPNKFYGINATVLSSTSQIQIAYDLNDNTKMYKRLKNITWSDWQQINIVGTIV